MPTITASDFRNGVTFEMDGQVMQVVEFQHVKPGKGAAFVRTKMDPGTFDLVPIGADTLGDSFRFVKENMVCKINSYKGKIFMVEPPTFVELEVTETDPGFKGDTATNVTKPATLETGTEIKVPLFINPGDKIKIDTRTGDYLERCKA